MDDFKNDPGFSVENRDWAETEHRSFFVSLVIKLSGGLIRTKKQAETALLAIAILFFAASAFIIWRTAFKTAMPLRNQGGPPILGPRGVIGPR